MNFGVSVLRPFVCITEIAYCDDFNTWRRFCCLIDEGVLEHCVEVMTEDMGETNNSVTYCAFFDNYPWCCSVPYNLCMLFEDKVFNIRKNQTIFFKNWWYGSNNWRLLGLYYPSVVEGSAQKIQSRFSHWHLKALSWRKFLMTYPVQMGFLQLQWLSIVQKSTRTQNLNVNVNMNCLFQNNKRFQLFRWVWI